MNQITALQHKVQPSAVVQICVYVMTLEILSSIFGLYFSSYRFLCKGKSASLFGYTKLFWVLLAGWPDGNFGFQLGLSFSFAKSVAKILIQCSCVCLCTSTTSLHLLLAFTTFHWWRVLGINTPKYFQRVKHRTVCISVHFLWYIIWKYAERLNLVTHSGS